MSGHCPTCGGAVGPGVWRCTCPPVVRLPPRLGVFIEAGQLLVARESGGAWMRADDVIAALRDAGVAHD